MTINQNPYSKEKRNYIKQDLHVISGVPRGVECQGPTPSQKKLQSFEKTEPNSQFCGKYICNNLIRIQVSLICKLSGTPDYGATVPKSPFSLPSVFN
jgi:hypothetical protein